MRFLEMKVVTEGANQLRPGSHVAITKPGGADGTSGASGAAAGSGGKPRGATGPTASNKAPAP